MTGADHHLVIGAGAERRESDRAREFLLALAQLEQVSRYHELDNVALDGPLETVAEITSAMCASGGRIHLLMDDEQVFVNRRRVGLSTGAFRTVHDLLVRLSARGLAGLELRKPLSEDQLREFLRAFHGTPRDIDSPAAWLRDALDAAGLDTIHLIPAGGDVKAGAAAIEMGEGELAALLYAKAVVLVRESFRCWKDEETRRYLGARAKRVIQQVISLTEKTRRPFLWLVHVKNADEYLFTHSANVALLSILLGSSLGLDRNRTCELGMAALFHDMGRIGLPPSLLGKAEAFSDGEKRLMARHPILGVNLLLELGVLNESLLERLIVVFEHNIDSNGYPRESWPGGLHLYSRIVAIADAYDAMTTRRSYRTALTPGEAMRELSRHSGSRYDADLVKVFAGVMGIYPLGSMVRLDTGEAGLVFHVDPSRPGRPLVKLVLDGSGSRIESGEVVDLGESDGAGGYVRSVVGTDDPVRHGIHVPAYLTEDVP